MKYSLERTELEHLRKLAKRQAEIAALPIMDARRKAWTDMNDAKEGARPVFAIESGTFDRDFMPDSIFVCKSDYGRRLEGEFLRNIRHHEIFGDDHVCKDSIEVAWHIDFNEFGIEIPIVHEKDSEGVVTGYHFECPIKDLATDGFDMLKPTSFVINKESTMEELDFLQNSFGDIIPVKIKMAYYGGLPGFALTQRMMRVMSMESFFMAMYDCPERLHALMAYLRDNAASFAKWAEDEGLLLLNNGNQCTCGTCFNFTTLLPKREIAQGGKVMLSDLWAGMDSQETVGVSPELFNEFCFPYYRELAAMFGLVYWGCCEPVHPLWETSLSKLPNLKAISISKWTDQHFMAETLAGKGIVYSRKPDPNLLGVNPELDEDAWAKEIRTTLEILDGKGIPAEFIVRDVYTMHGNLEKARRATEIARREIDRFYPPMPSA